MNAEIKTEFFTRKANVAAINKQISEKNTEVEILRRKINENENFIKDATQKIEVEEREIALGGPMSRRTMSVEQYRDLKKELKTWLNDLPLLKTELALLNQDLAILQADLAIERRALLAARSEIVAGIVDEAVNEFSIVAGEPFKNLVLAIVAAGGKDRGYLPSQQQQFDNATFKAIFEKILPNAFANKNNLPDLYESNDYINLLIEGVA